MEETLFTVGHSTHPRDRFIALLARHGITALCDVRSKPYSRMNPQFNKDEFRLALKEAGIRYVFLGEELGARTSDRTCYQEGRVQYDRLARTESFHHGLGRVQEGMKKYRIALMCAEKDPLECHRTILVGREFTRMGVVVQHIHADGSLESQDEMMRRLIKGLGLAESDMFRSRDDVLEDAYRIQGERIAYVIHPSAASPNKAAVALG